VVGQRRVATGGVRDNLGVTVHDAAGVLTHLTELEQRDAELASQIDRVVGLLHRADDIRGRAETVSERLGAIPDELAAHERAEADALESELAARAELAAAERRVEDLARNRPAGEDARARAQREAVRAREALGDAVARAERTVADRAALFDDERTLRAEAEALAAAARDVASAINGLPRVSDSGRGAPGATLAELEEWGARAHAALFVVRGGLESERERIVNEASALGASVLGDELTGSSVALVRRRIEQALAR